RAVIRFIDAASERATRDLSSGLCSREKRSASLDCRKQSEVPVAGDAEEVLIFVDGVLGDEALLARARRARVVDDGERVASTGKQRCFGLPNILRGELLIDFRLLQSGNL